MKFYQYPKCSTCRKAAKFLNANNIDAESIDITEQPPSKNELQLMLESYQGNVRKLFNTSGVQYRELDMKNKLPSMTAEQAIDLLAGNGKLIKRPFLITENNVSNKKTSIASGIVGFNDMLWQEFLANLSG